MDVRTCHSATRVTVGAVLSLLGLLVAAPASALVLDDDDGTIEATSADDGYEAELPLINTTDEAIELPTSVAVGDGCTLTVERLAIPPGRSANAVVRVPRACFDDETTEIQADLDPLPVAVTISAPAGSDLIDWAPLGLGLFVGTVAAVVLALRARERVQNAEEVLRPADDGSVTDPRYTAVTDAVSAKLAEIDADPVSWRSLERVPPSTTWPLRGLDSTWSLQDSFVSTTTIGTAGVLALLGSTDLLTPLLGSEPEAALSVMTVASLLNAALVGLAAAVVRLLSPGATVTARGAITGAGIVMLAGISQALTIGIGAALALQASPTLALVAAVAGAAAVALVLVQTRRGLDQILESGLVDDLPAIPDDAHLAWRATTPWDKAQLARSIVADYQRWIVSGPGTIASIIERRTVTSVPAASLLRDGSRRTAVLP